MLDGGVIDLLVQTELFAVFRQYHSGGDDPRPLEVSLPQRLLQAVPLLLQRRQAGEAEATGEAAGWRSSLEERGDRSGHLSKEESSGILEGRQARRMQGRERESSGIIKTTQNFSWEERECARRSLEQRTALTKIRAESACSDDDVDDALFEREL